jgi:outer membrane lipoprotein-sorting protein
VHRRLRSIALGLAALLAVSAPALAAAAAAAKPQPKTAQPSELDRILERFDKVQDSVHTLSAEFVETTENKLLKQPLSASGKFYLTKPASVMWEYKSPEQMRFVIDKDLYVGYFPTRKKVEKRDVHRWSEQIFRFFGLGQGSAELKKFYDIRTEDPGPDMKGSYLLVLDPVKRRVKKRVEQVKMWVDDTTLLPVRIQYLGKDGYVRVVRFHNLKLNPEIAAGVYTVQIPPDFKVTTGFSGFGADKIDR